MTDGLTSIINQLDRQKAAIERALAALREVEGTAAPAPASAGSARRKKVITASGQNRRSEGQKRRWAAKKAAEGALSASPRKAARKGGITAEGRQKLADAMKRRWAVKRAGSTAKKRARIG